MTGVQRPTRRLVGIGLDSASEAVIDDLVRAGELPALGALRERSARATLRSGEGHRHGVLWTQFMYGLEASLDAEWLRLSFDPGRYEAYQPNARHVVAGRRPFWERVPGLASVAFDLPRLAVSDRGVQVTGWGTHAPIYPRASRPAGLLTELDARFGPHPACENDYHASWHDPGRLRSLARAVTVGARRRAEIACHLMDREPGWELFLVAMSETHGMSEYTWHSVDPAHPLSAHPLARAAARGLRGAYRAIDDAVGRILAHAAGATVVLFSLDGMRPSHGDLPSVVLLPEVMHRAAFGRALLRDPDQEAWRRAGMPPVVPPRGRVWRDELDRCLVDRPPRPPGIGHALARVPGYQRARVSAVGRRVIATVKRARLGVFAEPIPCESDRDRESMEAERERITPHLFVSHYQRFWSRMRAFAIPSFGDGYVRINLAGRERDGIVPPADHLRACAEVEQLVAGCGDARTGEPIVEDVVRVPGDPFSPTRYADLVVHWRGPVDAIRHPTIGTVGPFPFHRTGTHSDRGFAWVAGEGIGVGDLGARSMLDVGPTMIALLGRRVPSDLGGTPMAGRDAGGPAGRSIVAAAPDRA